MRWIVLKKTEGYFQQSNGQLTLFQPDFIRDADCTKETPVYMENRIFRSMEWVKEFVQGFLEEKTQSI